VAVDDLGHARVGHVDGGHLGGASARRLGDERLGPEQGDVRRTGGEAGLDQLGATEDRLGHDHRVAVDGDVGVVGDDRLVERHREAGGHVAAVVGGAEHDQVGGVARLDLRGDGRGHRHALQAAAQVAGGVDLGRAVGAQITGDVGGVAAEDGLDGATQLTGLGEHLEGDRRHLAVGGLGEDPDAVESHVLFLLCSSVPSPQMTLRSSRNLTTRWKPSPSSSTISPA
jgi:hypothetical protein